MKVTPHDSRQGQQERQALMAMITSKRVALYTANLWRKGGNFQSQFANLIGGWVVEYTKKHHDAPKENIEHLYRAWKDGEPDDKLDDTVTQLLRSLSDDHYECEGLNESYAIAQIEDCFTGANVRRAVDDASAQLTLGSPQKAEEALRAYRSLQRASPGSVSDFFLDLAAVDEDLADEEESIIPYRGALGHFFGNDLALEHFIAFMSPEKRGKTSWLIDMAWRAALSRLKVLFLEMGDMSMKQLRRRFRRRSCRRPLGVKKYLYPEELILEEDGYEIKHCTEETTARITAEEIRAGMARLLRTKMRTVNQSYLRIQYTPANRETTHWIRSVVSNHADGGFVPSVLIVDYADLIKPSYSQDSKRDAIDQIWMDLRAISQEMHCLLITASQTNRASYRAETIQMEHASEDKRKLAHVNAAYGINQREAEKRDRVVRLNPIVRREEECISNEVVYVAGCPEICDPAVLSASRRFKEK